MASSKAALKAIKSAIDAGDFEKAATQAKELLSQDENNYNACMFLGFADEKLGRLDDAETALQKARLLKGQDVQPLKGLITLYEKQGSAKLDQYHDCVYHIARLYADQDDREQCQSVVNKYEAFVKRTGSRSQHRKALELLLPSCDLYPVLEGRVYSPSLIYRRILESSELDETEWIKTQIAERRTRLGARLDKVTQEVKCEAINKFQIEDKYQHLIEWTADDEVRHQLEEQLFLRALDNLQAVPADMKPTQRDKVLNTANGMVIIKHKFPPAWNVALEWVDAEDLQDWDVNILREYIEFFPDQGLAKVLRAFLDSDASPFPLPPASEGDEETPARLSEADQLITMIQGLEDSPQSMLANRILAYTYLVLEEFEDSADIARKAQKLIRDAQLTFALHLQNSLDAVNLTLANSLITHQAPRYHPEARQLFDDILQRKPNLTAALLGVGLILEEDEDYGEAAKFLKQASDRDPSNLRIRLEHAWCHALHADLKEGLSELDDILANLNREKTPNLAMKSEILYRIAYCQWHINTSSAARKDKSGPYRSLIDSIKANPAYAPPYTLLGIYFQDYGKSRQRARQALQKAFELSTSELTAAERLARQFAQNGEWDLVELVAQRVVDSGKARPAPGSKKKAFSWPYAALGTVQMNRQQYSQSIVSFQAALRISPQDYHSWVGLGESYHNSGRYIAASRAFTKAESLDHGLPADQSWFAKYMLASVQREVGAFDDAIKAYEAVLEVQKDEFGVLIALLQTCAENAWAKFAQGLYGQAVRLAEKAINVATTIATQKSDVFNLWRSVGDACSVVGLCKAFAGEVELSNVMNLFGTNLDPQAVSLLADVDRVDLESIGQQQGATTSNVADAWLRAAILSHKRAIHAAAYDDHAQAVAWYNLGWAEHQAYTSAGPSLRSKGARPKRFLKAAVRAFKTAIELEAGNSDFWNALGVVTMTLSPKVSQHSFVRSLHLNDRSARSWTNLGVLYLVNDDTQLANEAFTRAQSADPEYAAAWIGQGLLAMLYGSVKDARGLFTHAFEIADAASIPAKRHYAVSAFDHLLEEPSLSRDIHNLLQPLFALRQLYVQEPFEDPAVHLLSLFAERVSDYEAGGKALEEVCAAAEAEYEKSESNDALAKYAQAKADLARLQLSQGQYEAAVDNAETALDLSAEDDLGSAYAARRLKWRLSAHITAGLAQSRLGGIDESIKMFQVALEESEHAPEIVCMLAQVLWAKGGKAEKDAARSQLWNSVEKNPDHIQSVCLLAVVGLLDDDQDVLDAVEDDLKALRASDTVSVLEKMKISKVLGGVITCSGGAELTNAKRATALDAMTGIMTSPGQPQGWLELAQSTEDAYASEMALKVAKDQAPPNGALEADDLATAYANSGRSDNALVAVVLAPWKGFQLTAV